MEILSPFSQLTTKEVFLWETAFSLIVRLIDINFPNLPTCKSLFSFL